MQKTTPAVVKGKVGTSALVGSGTTIKARRIVESGTPIKARRRVGGELVKSASAEWVIVRNSVLKRSVAEQIDVIRSGLSAKNLVLFAEAVKVPQEAVFRVVGIPVTTAKRKLNRDENLDPATTERLTRIYRTEKLAEDVFGDGDGARRWLTTESLGLEGSPLSMLDTDLGAQEVSRVLYAIAYGGVV